MIQLPIMGIEQLLLELLEYEEIEEEDTNTWVSYEVCINEYLDRDLIRIITFYTSVYSAFILLIDLRLFHVYGGMT